MRNSFSLTLVFVLLSLAAWAQKQSAFKIQTSAEASVRSKKTILIKASKSKVWQVLADINRWPKWNSEVPGSKITGKTLEHAGFVWKTGDFTIHSQLHTVAPNDALGWTGESFGLHAVHNWSLAEKDGGTLVTVDESMEGFVAWLFKKSFNQNLAESMHHWLIALKTECEK